MLVFDDLLAARILSKQDATLRGTLLRLLAELRDGEQADLLEVLRKRGIASGEQIQETRAMMSRYKRGRALGVFVHLLSQHGLERDAVEAEARALGSGTTVVQLGARLVEQGVLREELERQLRFQARVIFDGDLARQLAEHLASTPHRPPKKELNIYSSERFNIAANLPKVASAVFRSETAIPRPSVEETAEILSSSSAGFDDFLRPPAFAIPDWVDTSVISGGMLMISDYRILGQIGKGGMGTVYLVHALGDAHTATALKVLDKGASDEAIARFKREALTASLFSHANVINVLDAGEEHGRHYMAMEFFDGVNLSDALKARGCFPWELALQVTRQLVDGLGAAHAAKVVHRDVKPSNVLLSHDLQTVRLADFGIATVLDMGELEDRVFRTKGSGLIGTPRYMSPEQASGGAIDPRSDLYSTGLILYELMTGALPFKGSTPTELLTARIVSEPAPVPASVGAPPGLHLFIKRLLAKELEQRFRNAASVLAELDKLLGSLA